MLLLKTLADSNRTEDHTQCSQLAAAAPQCCGSPVASSYVQQISAQHDIKLEADNLGLPRRARD